MQHADACSPLGSSSETSNPETNCVAYSPLRYGSSPGVSMFRPQRGSRARLMTGAQYVDHASPWFMKARASRPICAPVFFHLCQAGLACVSGRSIFTSARLGLEPCEAYSVRLKLIAVVIGKAKLLS